MINTSWHNYPSIYNLGHRYLADLLKDPVLVEEKVDGSQFSFGLINGELMTRSKGSQHIPGAEPKMFIKGIETARNLQEQGLLMEGWTYRGELLDKPKHNVQPYSRTPTGNVILFDINTGEETYLTRAEKEQEAQKLGLEIVPVLYEGILNDPMQLRDLLEKESILGGCKIEGVVIKNYARFGLDKKALMGKLVSEAFKEVHQREFKSNNPSSADVVQVLIESYKNEVRWMKAVQHLRDSGELDQSPKDIGKLILAVKEDISKECIEDIKDALYNWAIKRILSGATNGLPEWYKEELTKLQFEGMCATGN